jgi:hypothetical protein
MQSGLTSRDLPVFHGAAEALAKPSISILSASSVAWALSLALGEHFCILVPSSSKNNRFYGSFVPLRLQTRHHIPLSWSSPPFQTSSSSTKAAYKDLVPRCRWTLPLWVIILCLPHPGRVLPNQKPNRTVMVQLHLLRCFEQ